MLYLKNHLSEINSKEFYYLCGINPKSRSYDDDHGDSEVQRVLDKL